MKELLPLDIRRMEAAASHQARALAWFRNGQDTTRILSSGRRRCFQLRALEHLLEARRLLQETQRQGSGDGDWRSTLDQHLTRLELMIASVERLVHSQASLQERL